MQCLAFSLLHPCQPRCGARVGRPPAKRNVVTESRGQRQAAPRFQQVGSGPAPSPEEVMERARVRVAQLEVAIQLLDVEDPALPPLREALMKARAQASAPPLTDQITSSKMYVARKKKRLEEAEQGILEAVRKRAEVVAGEESWPG